jgi:hypothetical protein
MSLLFAMNIYGGVSILLSLVFSVLVGRQWVSKFWKKHLKKRKRVYFFLAIFSFLFFLLQLEESIEPFTLQILWGIHIVLFAVYSFFAIKDCIYDYKRIKKAQARRNT